MNCRGDHKHPTRPFGLAAALILATALNPDSARSQGDDSEYLTEHDVYFDVPMATSASRFPQALNKAPASVIIIDRAMIEASGAQQVPDLFRLVPGFQVYSPAYNHPTMNYHTLPDGFPSRLEVRIDGRSAYEPFTNTVFWFLQGLEIEDIDYIEVVRGSNIPAHGANAINGSVNIVTRSPLERSGATLRAEAGSNNTRNLSAGYSGTYEDFSYRISARYQSNDGFGEYQGEELDDDGKAVSANVKALWAPTLKDTVNLQLGYTSSEFTFDQGNARVEPSDIFEWEADLSYQHLDWRHQINDSHSLNLLASHSKTDLNAVESVQLLSEVIGFPPDLIFPGLDDFLLVLGIDDGYSRRYDLELSHTGVLGQSLKFDWGGAARRDEAKSQLHFSTNSSVSENYYRLFGNAEISATEWLTLNVGASWGHSDSIGSHPSYRLAGNFHLNSNNTIRLAANRASRAPSILAANYYRTLHQGDTIYDLDLISDPNIQEEERDSLELGYYGHFFDGKLSIDLKLFYEDNDYLIDVQTNRDYQGPLSIDNEVAFMTNSLESEDRGFEAYLRWQPNPRWLVTTQYTYMSIDASHHRRINPSRVSDRDDAVPSDIFGLMVDYDLGHGFQLAGSYFYQAEVDWKSALPVDSYDRFDLNIRKQFRFDGLKGRVELVAQNMFGEDYTEYRQFQEFEPRYYLRVLTEF